MAISPQRYPLNLKMSRSAQAAQASRMQSFARIRFCNLRPALSIDRTTFRPAQSRKGYKTGSFRPSCPTCTEISSKKIFARLVEKFDLLRISNDCNSRASKILQTSSIKETLNFSKSTRLFCLARLLQTKLYLRPLDPPRLLVEIQILLDLSLQGRFTAAPEAFLSAFQWHPPAQG